MLPVPQKNQVFEFQKNQPVMEQVKKQRQPSEPMDVINILESSTGSREEAIKLYNTLAGLVTGDPDFRVMRANNTLFMYNNNRDGSVDLAMETADTPRDLVDSLKQFANAMRIAGFKRGKFEIDNPQIIKAMQMAGLKVATQPSNVLGEDGMTPTMLGTVEV